MLVLIWQLILHNIPYLHLLLRPYTQTIISKHTILLLKQFVQRLQIMPSQPGRSQLLLPFILSQLLHQLPMMLERLTLRSYRRNTLGLSLSNVCVTGPASDRRIRPTTHLTLLNAAVHLPGRHHCNLLAAPVRLLGAYQIPIRGRVYNNLHVLRVDRRTGQHGQVVLVFGVVEGQLWWSNQCIDIAASRDIIALVVV